MRRRLILPLLLSLSLTVSACAGTYERVAGGAAMGGVAGAATGYLCCKDPSQTGKGAIIGIAVGALLGLVLDWVDPV